MKTIIAFALLALSFAASAVTISIDMTAGEINRFAVALGKGSNLMTPGTPAVVDAQGNVTTPAVAPVPRNATNAELKGFVASSIRDLIRAQEKQTRVKALLDADVEPTPVDPK